MAKDRENRGESEAHPRLKPLHFSSLK